jgi:hypothetical protein
VLARLWLIAPEPRAMMRATHDHVKTATDVLRIASVLMRGNAALAEPMRLASVPRRLRRAVLEALEQLPADALVEDMRRHRGLWKRVGERLHPGEHVRELPNVAAAFAAVRGKPAQTTWAGRVEATLASGDARAAAALLRQRPDELLRRADHLARVAAARQPAAIDDATAALRDAASAGAPAALLQLAAHAARRTAPWPRRVFFPHGDVLRAYGIPDARAPLAPDLADAIVATTRSELLARAAARRNYARAVLDRELGDLPVTGGTRRPSKATLAWPRGSELALPGGDPLRLVLEGDRELTLVMFDDHWRHVRTCSDPAHVDLDVAELRASGARHVVAVVSRGGALAPDRFVGLGQAPAADAPFDPRAVATRFDLYGRAPLAVPLAIDLATRRVRWLDVRINDRGALARAGGYRAMLAHVGRDFADLAAPRARPTLWDVAAIHAAARANTIYVRDGGAIALYRRRDDEPHLARLARLHAGEHDGVSKIPPANAPTWFAVLRADVLLPKGSEGFVLDPRTLTADGVTSLAAADLVAALAKT